MLPPNLIELSSNQDWLNGTTSRDTPTAGVPVQVLFKYVSGATPAKLIEIG
jgi:hypothetical protein